ncbi:MAG: phosphopantetheine-binding protein [Myxococcota bacterium]|nr:phosphopantetheine-binding protein [Myxococcota bacterium]
MIGELKALVIEALMLEDVTVDDIDTHERLFIEGLGLDSIDALELAMAIQRRYGIRIEAEDEETRAIFRSIGSLAAHIHTQLSQVSP